jgi:hypothetical protein
MQHTAYVNVTLLVVNLLCAEARSHYRGVVSFDGRCCTKDRVLSNEDVISGVECCPCHLVPMSCVMLPK